MTVVMSVTLSQPLVWWPDIWVIPGVREPYQAGSPHPQSEMFWRAFWHDMGSYRPGWVAA